MIRFVSPMPGHSDRFWKTLAATGAVTVALVGVAVLALLGPVPWRGSSQSSPDLSRVVTSSWFVGPGVSFGLVDREFEGLTVTVDGTVESTEFKMARMVWDWGDGTVEDGWFPGRHTYAQPGRYTLTVQVYDDRGTRIASQSGSINVAK